MEHYSWSWDQYCATPPYVRRACWDLMVAKRDARRAAEERAAKG